MKKAHKNPFHEHRPGQTRPLSCWLLMLADGEPVPFPAPVHLSLGVFEFRYNDIAVTNHHYNFSSSACSLSDTGQPSVFHSLPA